MKARTGTSHSKGSEVGDYYRCMDIRQKPKRFLVSMMGPSSQLVLEGYEHDLKDG